MKITDSNVVNVIKNGERDLIEAVINNIDLNTVKKIIQTKANAQTLTSKGGKIIAHNNEIAFKLNFSIEMNGSLMFDRQGNYLPESANDMIHLKKPIQKNPEPEDNFDINPPIHDYNDEPDTQFQLEIDDDPDPVYKQKSEPDQEQEIKLNLEPDSSDDDIDPVDSEINDDDDINFWEMKNDYDRKQQLDSSE